MSDSNRHSSFFFNSDMIFLWSKNNKKKQDKQKQTHGQETKTKPQVRQTNIKSKSEAISCAVRDLSVFGLTSSASSSRKNKFMRNECESVLLCVIKLRP